MPLDTGRASQGPGLNVLVRRAKEPPGLVVGIANDKHEHKHRDNNSIYNSNNNNIHVYTMPQCRVSNKYYRCSTKKEIGRCHSGARSLFYEEVPS